MCEVQCKAYREQYGDEFICVVPTNLYGKYDSYGEDKSHVVPALIKKAVLAKTKGEPMIVLGTGKPLRQFCYTPDLAKLILWVLFQRSQTPFTLISLVPEEEYSIRELAETIVDIVGVEKGLDFDETKADG